MKEFGSYGRTVYRAKDKSKISAELVNFSQKSFQNNEMKAAFLFLWELPIFLLDSISNRSCSISQKHTNQFIRESTFLLFCFLKVLCSFFKLSFFSKSIKNTSFFVLKKHMINEDFQRVEKS